MQEVSMQGVLLKSPLQYRCTLYSYAYDKRKNSHLNMEPCVLLDKYRSELVTSHRP